MLNLNAAAKRAVNNTLDIYQRLDWLRWLENPALVSEDRGLDLLHLIVNSLTKEDSPCIIFSSAEEYISWLKVRHYVQNTPHRKWTPFRLNLIKQMIDEGKTYTEIGKQFGVSQSAIASTVSIYKLKTHD